MLALIISLLKLESESETVSAGSRAKTEYEQKRMRRGQAQQSASATWQPLNPALKFGRCYCRIWCSWYADVWYCIVYSIVYRPTIWTLFAFGSDVINSFSHASIRCAEQVPLFLRGPSLKYIIIFVMWTWRHITPWFQGRFTVSYIYYTYSYKLFMYFNK